MYYKDTTGHIINNVTAGLPIWHYTLPLCILWFSASSSTGVVCREKGTVLKVLKEQRGLESFVLVANNDALEFFRRDETWYTRKSRLEDVLDELEEKVILAREMDDERRIQDRLEYESNLLVNQQHPQFPCFCNSIGDND